MLDKIVAGTLVEHLLSNFLGHGSFTAKHVFDSSGKREERARKVEREIERDKSRHA